MIEQGRGVVNAKRHGRNSGSACFRRGQFFEEASKLIAEIADERAAERQTAAVRPAAAPPNLAERFERIARVIYAIDKAPSLRRRDNLQRLSSDHAQPVAVEKRGVFIGGEHGKGRRWGAIGDRKHMHRSVIKPMMHICEGFPCYNAAFSRALAIRAEAADTFVVPRRQKVQRFRRTPSLGSTCERRPVLLFLLR